MPEKYGDAALFKAIYSDEMSLIQVARRRACSIKSWFPAVEDSAGNTGTHITLLLTASPEIGLIWYKIHEGAVNSEDILQLYRDTAKASVEHKPLSGFTSYKISER